MSTVVFYGDTLWADTCVTYKFNSRREQSIGRKLARHGNSVFGFTGSLDGAAHFMHWVKNGRKPRIWYWLFDSAIVNTVDIFEWDGHVLTTWKSVLKWKAFGLGYWKKTATYIPGRDGTIFYMGSGEVSISRFIVDNKTFDPRSAIRYASKNDIHTNSILEFINLDLHEPQRVQVY